MHWNNTSARLVFQPRDHLVDQTLHLGNRIVSTSAEVTRAATAPSEGSLFASLQPQLGKSPHDGSTGRDNCMKVWSRPKLQDSAPPVFSETTALAFANASNSSNRLLVAAPYLPKIAGALRLGLRFQVIRNLHDAHRMPQEPSMAQLSR